MVKRLLNPLLPETSDISGETGPAITDTGVSMAAILPFLRHNVQKKTKKSDFKLDFSGLMLYTNDCCVRCRNDMGERLCALLFFL